MDQVPITSPVPRAAPDPNLRDVMSHVPSAVAAIMGAEAGQPLGLTMSSFASIDWSPSPDLEAVPGEGPGR